MDHQQKVQYRDHYSPPAKHGRKETWRGEQLKHSSSWHAHAYSFIKQIVEWQVWVYPGLELLIHKTMSRKQDYNKISSDSLEN